MRTPINEISHPANNFSAYQQMLLVSYHNTVQVLSLNPLDTEKYMSLKTLNSIMAEISKFDNAAQFCKVIDFIEITMNFNRDEEFEKTLNETIEIAFSGNEQSLNDLAQIENSYYLAFNKACAIAKRLSYLITRKKNLSEEQREKIISLQKCITNKDVKNLLTHPETKLDFNLDPMIFNIVVKQENESTSIPTPDTVNGENSPNSPKSSLSGTLKRRVQAATPIPKLRLEKMFNLAEAPIPSSTSTNLNPLSPRSAPHLASSDKRSKFLGNIAVLRNNIIRKERAPDLVTMTITQYNSLCTYYFNNRSIDQTTTIDSIKQFEAFIKQPAVAQSLGEQLNDLRAPMFIHSEEEASQYLYEHAENLLVTDEIIKLAAIKSNPSSPRNNNNSHFISKLLYSPPNSPRDENNSTPSSPRSNNSSNPYPARLFASSPNPINRKSNPNPSSPRVTNPTLQRKTNPHPSPHRNAHANAMSPRQQQIGPTLANNFLELIKNNLNNAQQVKNLVKNAMLIYQRLCKSYNKNTERTQQIPNIRLLEAFFCQSAIQKLILEDIEFAPLNPRSFLFIKNDKAAIEYLQQHAQNLLITEEYENNPQNFTGDQNNVINPISDPNSSTFKDDTAIVLLSWIKNNLRDKRMALEYIALAIDLYNKRKEQASTSYITNNELQDITLIEAFFSQDIITDFTNKNFTDFQVFPTYIDSLAEDGMSAVEYLNKYAPDLVITNHTPPSSISENNPMLRRSISADPNTLKKKLSDSASPKPQVWLRPGNVGTEKPPEPENSNWETEVDFDNVGEDNDNIINSYYF